MSIANEKVRLVNSVFLSIRKGAACALKASISAFVKGRYSIWSANHSPKAFRDSGEKSGCHFSNAGDECTNATSCLILSGVTS